MTKRSQVLLLLEPLETAALMIEEAISDGADIPEGTLSASFSYTLLRQIVGSVRRLSNEMRANPVEENAGQMLTRLSNDLASMAKGFNMDGYHDTASEAQKMIMLVVYFREQLSHEQLDEHTWKELTEWKPPKEDDDEKTTGDREP